MPDNGVRQRIAGNLRTIAKVKKVKQVDIARACGVSKGAVSNWFKGSNSIDMDFIPTIADILGVSVDVLLGSSVDADTATMLSIFSQLDEQTRTRVIAYASFELDKSGSRRTAMGEQPT